MICSTIKVLQYLLFGCMFLVAKGEGKGTSYKLPSQFPVGKEGTELNGGGHVSGEIFVGKTGDITIKPLDPQSEAGLKGTPNRVGRQAENAPFSGGRPSAINCYYCNIFVGTNRGRGGAGETEQAENCPSTCKHPFECDGCGRPGERWTCLPWGPGTPGYCLKGY